MKNILLTGGCGFIGTHTAVSLLENGYNVFILDSLINSSFESINKIQKVCNIKPLEQEKLFFFEDDIRNKEAIKSVFEKANKVKKPIDAVIHFAGLKSVSQSLKVPIKYWDINVGGSINLCDVMNENGCNTIVFSSSATIYGQSDNNLINENNPIHPINPYGTTKCTVENFLNELFNSNPTKWKIASLRYFNPIGAHSSGLIGENPKGEPNNIFPIILNVASRRRSNLSIYGNDWPTNDGTGIRDYVHVMDLAEGHLRALRYLEKENNKIINLNIGTGKGTSVLELVKTFEKINKLKIPYTFAKRRSGDVPCVVADNSLSLKLLKWQPKRTVEEMCRDGWLWRCKNPN